uniref:Silcatein 2 n=1 Tax=Spongilla lacustris TaxID=6055 RepID=D3DEQ2_SPOLA|nr:silcatein 2 [Spongilla lacustris]CAQ54052.1 silicatein alpha 4 [Spongilla lacustris]
MKFIILLSFVFLSVAFSYEFVEEWHLWKGQHQKSYTSELEELERHAIWSSNKKYIEEHNARSDLFGYTLAMNSLGDLSMEEYNEIYLTHETGNYTHHGLKMFQAPKGVQYADSIDWRAKGAVTSIKYQAQCGASYAFAATGALEGASALANDKQVTLSEQNIIDCSVPYGNHGCSGGDTYTALKYVIDNGGIDTESSCSFQAKQSSCQYNSKNSGASATGVINIAFGSESDLLAAVATVGPVAIAVDANTNAFRFYQSGVFDSSSCSNTKLNHAMLVTGYGSYNGKDYWLVKNSWGKNWGDSGYILMVRNKYNQCGIASDSLYPTL